VWWINVGIVAVLVWGAFLYATWRMLSGFDRQRIDDDVRFQLDAAPWSDNHVETLLGKYPRNAIILNQYVNNALERKDTAEALRRSDMFLSRARRSGQAWMVRSNVLRRADREDEAQELLRTAVRRMPRDIEVLLGAARDAERHHDWPEAARRFELARKYHPRRIEGYTGAAEAYANAGDFDAAEAVVAAGLKLVPHIWWSWHTAALVAEKRGDLDEAIGRWEAMRNAFPGEAPGFIRGAQALARAGRAEEAAALIREARDYFPGNKHVVEAAQKLAPEPPADAES
jgi:predicted Zn-dependent protease